MKLWIKTYVGDKITNSIVLSKKGVSRDVFDEMLKEAVDAFDLSPFRKLQQREISAP